MTDTTTEGFSKGVLGGVVGFGLYLLITGLGFGGTGRGASAQPKDPRRLAFVMQGPLTAGRPMIFRSRDDDPSLKLYAIDEVVARVKAGGRADVSLKIRGDVIQSAVDQATALLKHAGIAVWKEEEPGAPRVAGNARGEYGRVWGVGA